MDSTTSPVFVCQLSDEDIAREREELYEVCRLECGDGECQLRVANGGVCPLDDRKK